MAEKKDCLDAMVHKDGSPTPERIYIESNRDKYIQGGLSEKEATLKAARDLQSSSVNALHNAFADLGVKGFEKLASKTEVPPQPQQPEVVSNEIGKEYKISKALGVDVAETEPSKYASTKIVDDNGKPKVVYHGTWADAPFEDFKEGDTYFTDNYDTAKMFGINREGGVEVEHMDMQGKPFVMTVTDKKGGVHKMVIAHSDMSAILPDMDYDVSPVGKWDKGDINEVSFREDGIQHHFGIPKKDIKSFEITERGLGENVDEFGVSKHFINIKNPLIINAKGGTWGSGGGDVQLKINEARESGRYDGVVIKNIVEGGIMNPDIKPTTTYIVFNKSQTNEQNKPTQPEVVGNEVSNKIVDESGKPLVVYHGSREPMADFDESKIGINDKGFYGKGIYFSPQQGQAEMYTGEAGAKKPENVKPYHIEIKNPFTIDVKDVFSLYGKDIPEGYDGVIVTSQGHPYEYVVKSKSQIKTQANEQNKPTQVPLQTETQEANDETINQAGEGTKKPAPKTSKAGEEKSLVGKRLSAVFAGGKITGEVTADLGEKIKILGDDGTKYTVRKTAILKEGETATQHIESESGKTEKVYEQIMGSRPNAKTKRIPVDPIISEGEPKRLSEILFDVSKATGKRINYNKPSRSRAIGTYSPGSAVVKIRFAGDLDTTAHEFGHSIDDNFGILSDLKNNPDPIIEKELEKFSKFGSTPPKKHPDKRMYRLGEGFAEWLRAFIVNPTQAIATAPEVHKLYEAKVSPEYKAAFKQFSNDVRTWAGSSGRDMVLSNIEWKPSENKEGIISKIFSKSDNSDMFEVTWADKVAANFINPLQAFDKSVQYAAGLKGLDELLPRNDPSILARLLLSIDRKFGEFLETGLRDAEDNLITDADGNAKTFNWLLEPFDNSDEATIKKEMEDTLAYMVAERTVEKGETFQRESIISGIGGGIFKDVDVAKKALDEFNNGDQNRLERIKEAAERYRSYANDILDYMVAKGRLDAESVETIKDNNLQYVAFNRIMESAPNEEIELFNIKKSSNRLGSKAEPIHKLKGSTRTIRNPYISLMDRTYKSIKEADRNDVLRQYRDLLTQGRTMHQGTPIKLGEIGFVAQSGEANTIPIFIDGKLENWKFQDDIYKGLRGLDTDGYKLPGVLTLHARILRNSITKFPIFAARNWVRDLQDRLIKSDSGFRHLFGDKKHWEDVARNGGLNAGYYMRGRDHYYGLMEEAIKELSKDKKTIFADPSKIKKVWRGYEDFLQKSETANRVAEYRSNYSQAKKKGMDDYNASLYAAFRSRDLMDFALMGHYMKIVNQVIPFSNAAIQGIRSSVVRALDNPVAFIGRIALFTMLPQVALWAWNHRSKEDAEEYEAFSQYQRDMFWNIKIGKNKWLSIPKPYELGIFSAGVDRLLSKVFGYNDNAFKGYAGSIAQTISPFDMGSLSAPALPFVEAYTNKSFYTGKHIIPQHEDALDLSLRHTENASRLGKFIQKFTSIDARKIDHIIRSQFGYTGAAALDVSNIGIKNTRYTLGLHDLGFFNQSPGYNSDPVQKMVRFAERYNLKQSVEYKYFNNVASKYFDATTDEQKDDIAKQLVEVANKTMERWDKKDIADKKSEKFKKRQ